MTNVAIAFPRSPVHLAHAAYDLHAASGGRFRLGLGSQIQGAHRTPLRRHLVTPRRPHGRRRSRRYAPS
ncbi:LLM class flavin-dependent oxidoreductase [Yinghuangia aomiensis]